MPDATDLIGRRRPSDAHRYWTLPEVWCSNLCANYVAWHFAAATSLFLFLYTSLKDYLLGQYTDSKGDRVTPDIAMCSGKGCPHKKKCYRYRARPDGRWQTYFSHPPCAGKRQKCEYFEPLREGDELAEGAEHGE